MREIEFRGKTDKGGWEYGDLVKKKGLFFIHFYEVNGFECMYQVISETVGQYTGLKDKNGNKIFEGDVVRIFSNYYKEWINGFAEIKFSYGYVGGWIVLKGIEYMSLGLHHLELEIIGNIHDNPELLEDK